MSTSDDRAASRVRLLSARDSVAQRLGVQIVAVSAGRAEVKLVVSEDDTNSWGVTHGGVVFMLADIAFSYAANCAEHKVVAQTANVSFRKETGPGDILIARAVETISKGRQRVFDVVVTRANDASIVADMRGYGYRL